ncbi:AAA family ATPase [Flexithrix dorotheae]|uniref:AAA family ATPase n=1 Tax=Flexithrix dorotheae TaxID=70993 RepID=UPI00037AF55B|nr:AAA family ATPase [Flexithrix dorotheae]
MNETFTAIKGLKENMQASIIGQEALVERIIITLLADGNMLLEGLPGLAKTRAIKSLAKNLDCGLSRIQFTPDLLPSDITGTEIYQPEAEEKFVFQQGPIFNNLILADEINRAPAKVQAALLEAMEERQVTVAGKTHNMEPLFMVLATQNPVEQEGTYPLPEAQMDRFLMKTIIDYPDKSSEMKILDLVKAESKKEHTEKHETIAQEIIFKAREEIKEIHVSDAMKTYIVDLVDASRYPDKYSEQLAKWLEFGASPRGTIALEKAARVHAWLAERDFVNPDDIRALIHDILRHRIMLSYEANADRVTAEDVISELVKLVAVPA